jgi:hypothetical protein
MQQSFSINLSPTPIKIQSPKKKMAEVIKINVNPPPKDALREHLRRTTESGRR